MEEQRARQQAETGTPAKPEVIYNLNLSQIYELFIFLKLHQCTYNFWYIGSGTHTTVKYGTLPLTYLICI